MAFQQAFGKQLSGNQRDTDLPTGPLYRSAAILTKQGLGPAKTLLF